jgi:iron complex transport system substrate-binding protein
VNVRSISSLTPPRIVSLLPSATEIVCALGAAEHLVGISHECDYPPEIRDRAVLTHPRIDTEGSSREIDDAVRRVIDTALSVYAVDDEKLAALEPDVIVTQDLCAVCAVSLDDVRGAVARLSRRDDVRVVSLHPTRLSEALEDIERVAIAIDRPAEGRALSAGLDARMRSIAARSARLSTRPRVASLEWIEPLMLGGTWMPELIERAGGVAAGVEPGQPAPTVAPRDFSLLQPDVVVVKACGLSLERALAERAIIERSVLDVLPDTARVYVTDGNAFFNRPGPRLVESLEIMAACVHPQAFGDFAEKHAAVIRRLTRS